MATEVSARSAQDQFQQKQVTELKNSFCSSKVDLMAKLIVQEDSYRTAVRENSEKLGLLEAKQQEKSRISPKEKLVGLHRDSGILMAHASNKRPL